VRQREGKRAEHQDVLVLQRGEPRKVLVADFVAVAAEVADRVVHVLGVPEHEDVEREAPAGPWWGESGSGRGVYREVELNALVRAMLDEWVAERAKIAQEGETSFFVSNRQRAVIAIG